MNCNTTHYRANSSSVPGDPTLLVCLAGLVSEAAAQTASEEIIVTGTRIARQNFDSSTAVVSIGQDAITRTGAPEVGETLRSLPQIGASAFTPTSAGALATTGFGLSTVQLRNLDENRTLVLINGRRMVAGNPGTQNVDFNAIPTEMIDRIDVVTGGASAIYGSDALAGVINIITKKDFGGLVLSGRYGETEQNDNKSFKLSATGGTGFANDRGHATIGFTWSKEDGAYACDHGDGVSNCFDNVNALLNDTPPGSIKDGVGPLFSSYSLNTNVRVPFADGSDEGVVVGPGGTVRPFSSTLDGFNRNARRRLASPIERYSFNSQIDFKINDWANWFMEGSYNSTKAQTGGEPFPLDSHNIYGDGTANFDVQCDGVTCINGVSALNPYVPAALLARLRANNPGVPDAALQFGFRRRTDELGNRDGEALRQTFRVVTGFDGDITENLSYNASFTYGRTTSHEDATGQINVLNMRQALNAIVGPGGTIICADPVARAQGCVPVNLFGVGSITPTAAAYITAGNSRDAQIDEFVGNAYFTGGIPVFSLPGGAPQWVLGAEYRKEKSRDVPDSLTQLGLNASNKTPPTFGDFDVSEAFGELRLPILKDASFAKALDLNLAARFSDYSTVGQTRAYSASLEYSPVDWLKTRLQYSRAVRAPNISELFQPGLQDFPSVTDPCSGLTVSGGKAAFFNTRDPGDPAAVLSSGVDASTVGDPVAAACLSNPALAARVARDGGFAISQAELQGTQGFDSGNVTLKAEKADTYSAGFVFRPNFNEWISPFSLSVDYYNIKIDDAIDTLDEQILVDQCYQPGLPAAFCGTAAQPLVERISAGPFIGALLNVNQIPLNAATLKSEGIDVQADYSWDFGGGGKLGLDLVYSYLINRETTPFAGSDPIDYTGTVGSPRHKATMTTDYSIGPFSVSWQTEYIGPANFDNDPSSALFGARQKAVLFHDAQFKYTIKENTIFTIGVDNVFNEYVHIGGNSGEVPVAVTGDSSVGIDTLPQVYDALGRRFYVGLTAKF